MTRQQFLEALATRKAKSERARPTEPTTVHAAALWFIACQQAQGFRDLTQKETARMLLDGLPPTAMADLDEWLVGMSDLADPGVDVEGEILRLLDEHFGLHVLTSTDAGVTIEHTNSMKDHTGDEDNE